MQPVPPTEAPRRRHGCLSLIGAAVVAVVVLVIVVAIIGAVASDDENGDTATDDTDATSDDPVSNSDNEENPPEADVAISSCEADPAIGWIKAAGTITNNSSEPSTYIGTIEFTVDGTRYGEAPFSSSAVAPGQAVEFEAPGAVEARPNTVCRVAQVERFAS